MARVRVSVLALLLAGVLPLPLARAADPSAKELVQAFGASDWKTRGPAYHALIRKRDPAAIPHLRRAIPSFDFTGQYYGVVILDRYPRDRVCRTWRALLDCDVPWLEFAAGTALLRTGDDAGVEAAVAAISDPSVTASIRLRMLQRAGPKTDPRILAAFRTHLHAKADSAALVHLIPYLYRAQDRLASPRAQLLLDHDRPGVRAMVAAFLYGLGYIQTAPVLAEALGRGIPYYEFGVVQAILPGSRRLADTVLDAVAAHLAHETNPSLLLQQITFLGVHRHQKARHAIRPFLFHANDKVAEKALEVLVSMSGSVEEDTLRPLLIGDDVARRLWASEALRRRGDTSGVGVVIDTLRNGAVAQRADAAQVLATYTMDLAVDPLLAALADEQVQVRKAAHAGLARLLRRLFPYRRVDLAAAAYAPDADPVVRAAAIDLIRAWWSANRDADW